jgi:hypothetical protein
VRADGGRGGRARRGGDPHPPQALRAPCSHDHATLPTSDHRNSPGLAGSSFRRPTASASPLRLKGSSGRTDGHRWGINVAVSGEVGWPPLGRNRWPLTLLLASISSIRRASRPGRMAPALRQGVSFRPAQVVQFSGGAYTSCFSGQEVIASFHVERNVAGRCIKWGESDSGCLHGPRRLPLASHRFRLSRQNLLLCTEG